MLLLRNLAFYLAFYIGSIAYVLTAIVAAAFGEAPLRRVVVGWSLHHRRCARIFLGIRVRFEGPLPEGAVLIAMRHESFFEAIEIPALLPSAPVPFAKRELFLIPGWGWVARTYGGVPVARDEGAKALRAMVVAAKEHARAGRMMVIFPEGTRTAHGTRGELRAGFAGLYKLLGLPVVPVAVDSGPLYHRLLKRPGVITYRFAEAIPPGLPRAAIEAQVEAAINALNS